MDNSLCIIQNTDTLYYILYYFVYFQYTLINLIYLLLIYKDISLHEGKLNKVAISMFHSEAETGFLATIQAIFRHLGRVSFDWG